MCARLARRVGAVLTVISRLKYRGIGATILFDLRMSHMRKLAFLLAVVVAAATPSLAFAAKKHHHHHAVAAEPADPNADTNHLIHDFFVGK